MFARLVALASDNSVPPKEVAACLSCERTPPPKLPLTAILEPDPINFSHPCFGFVFGKECANSSRMESISTGLPVFQAFFNLEAFVLTNWSIRDAQLRISSIHSLQFDALYWSRRRTGGRRQEAGCRSRRQGAGGSEEYRTYMSYRPYNDTFFWPPAACRCLLFRLLFFHGRALTNSSISSRVL